jgi:hypothetical protein
MVNRSRRLPISYNDCISEQIGKCMLNLDHGPSEANHTASVSQKFAAGSRTGVVDFFGTTLGFVVLQHTCWEQRFKDRIGIQPMPIGPEWGHRVARFWAKKLAAWNL